MTDFPLPAGLALHKEAAMTPAGIQPARVLLYRRILYCAAFFGSCAALACGLGVALGMDRHGARLSEIAILILSLTALPWFAAGFWNALLGFWLLRSGKSGLDQSAPFCHTAHSLQPLRLRVAVIMTVRNEDAARVFARLGVIRNSLGAACEDDIFDYFVLSDTSDPSIASEEEAASISWAQNGQAAGRLFYRRRDGNEGFKAGNIRDFLERWGEQYDLMLPLDADSVMSGETIVKMVRIMQAYPKLGILQSLTVGTPAITAFARIFQFGMRHAMRSYTIGNAWWAGDCGPYWGHNALIRVKPFQESCKLPILSGKPPFGGPILSHDQLEAALMRRAGYEVRVLPFEVQSYEENPPTLLEFMKRDLRWSQGNLQYWRLIGWPGLTLVHRAQLALALLMYAGSAAAALAVAIAIGSALMGGLEDADARAAALVFAAIYFMSLAPKLAALADIALTKNGAAPYGGWVRLFAGVLLEIPFTWFLSVIMTFRSTIFAWRSLFANSASWGRQERDAHSLSWIAAARYFWLETFAGLSLFGVSALFVPDSLPWAMAVIVPLALSVPFAVATSSKSVSMALARPLICGIPEEFTPVELLKQISDVGGKASL